MIYDDQPKMMEVAREATSPHYIGGFVLERAFAAIDREALIDRVNRDPHCEPSTRGSIERILVSAGVLPAAPLGEREAHDG